MNLDVTRRLIKGFRAKSSLPRYYRPLFPITHDEIPAFLATHLNLDTCDEYCISHTTDPALQFAAFNLLQALMDCRKTLYYQTNSEFTLLSDYGVCYKSFSNASGGTFYGPYRSFLVERYGKEYTVSIGLNTYNTSARPDWIRTCLCVGIDDDRTSHHSVQLVWDSNVEVVGAKVHFYHHGKITVGKLGSAKVSDIREFIRTKKSDFIFGNRFYLGSLTNNRNWVLDDPEVCEFMDRLITYALIRDEFRNYRKSINSRGLQQNSAEIQ